MLGEYSGKATFYFEPVAAEAASERQRSQPVVAAGGSPAYAKHD
jgi:hypothetical protein